PGFPALARLRAREMERARAEVNPARSQLWLISPLLLLDFHQLIRFHVLQLRGGAVRPEHLEGVGLRLPPEAEVTPHVVLLELARPALNKAHQAELPRLHPHHGPNGVN